jgi:DNA replication factor GINS
MNLDELQSIRDRERQSDSLQQLREDFYVEVGEFVRELREERDAVAERADDPFDAPEVNRLTDDINTAEQTVEAIYERRVGKLVKMASFAAADMPTEDEGLTAEERQLFERMVAAIEENRDTVMAVIDGDEPPATGGEPGGTEQTTPSPADRAADGSTDTGQPTPADGDPADAVDSGSVDAADLMAGSDETPANRSSDGSATPETTADADPAPGSADAGPQSGADSPSGPDADPEPGVEGPAGPDDSPPDGEPVPPELRGEDPAEEPAPEQAETTTIGGTDGGETSTGGERRPGDETGRPARDGGGADVDRETVRITDDVGQIFGVDEREYELTREDVVTLPSENAAPLVERDVAERLDRTGN